jgi:hypothetical protein
MSAGLLPVSLGMLPGLVLAAVVRRVRRAALVLAPTGEWGTDLRPGDFAGLTVVAVVAAIIAGLGLACCVWVLVRVNRETVTHIAPRVVFTWGDISRYVRETEPDLPRAVQIALEDAIAFDAEVPEFGQDWAPWLKANHSRLVDRAKWFVECDDEGEVSA